MEAKEQDSLIGAQPVPDGIIHWALTKVSELIEDIQIIGEDYEELVNKKKELESLRAVYEQFQVNTIATELKVVIELEIKQVNELLEELDNKLFEIQLEQAAEHGSI